MMQINYFIIGLLLFSFISDVLLIDEANHGTSQKSDIETETGRSKEQKNSRIIEGIKAEHEDYRFIASVLRFHGLHMCGGSIVSDTVILTAAHCCFDQYGMPISADSLSVAVGSGKWRAGRKIEVNNYVVHEDYVFRINLNDIALLVLKHKMRPSDNVETVHLAHTPENEQYNPVVATAIGWGFISDKGLLVTKLPEDLFSVDIYSVPLSECRKHYEKISDGQICFTGTDKRGTCDGDSGGPLVMWKDFTLVQIGIVSFGVNCNNTKPEVYTRVSAYYSWIKNKVDKIEKKNST